MMPGIVPKGAAIRLSAPAGHLGIAEGIETALPAAKLFGVQCWAAVCSSGLATWVPPDETIAVTIFADHDAKFAGQAAAFALAHRLAGNDRRQISVEVKIPEQPGKDWCDVLAEG